MSDTLFTEDVHGHYRYTDPETSKLAAVAQIGRKHDAHSKVLRALLDAFGDGLTDHELAAAVGLIQTSAGKRRGELRDAGYVGSPCVVWHLTALGVTEAQSRVAS